MDLLFELRLVLWRVENNIYVHLLLSNGDDVTIGSLYNDLYAGEKAIRKRMKRSKHEPINANKLTTNTMTKFDY